MKLILSKIKTYFGKLDKLLLFMCMGIAFFAVFIQYTLYENDISSAVTASQYKTQIIAFIAGLVIAMALAAINYKYLAKLWFIYVPLAMGLPCGKIVLSGTGAELLASEQVKKAYLGG